MLSVNSAISPIPVVGNGTWQRYVGKYEFWYNIGNTYNCGESNKVCRPLLNLQTAVSGFLSISRTFTTISAQLDTYEFSVGILTRYPFYAMRLSFCVPSVPASLVVGLIVRSHLCSVFVLVRSRGCIRAFVHSVSHRLPNAEDRVRAYFSLCGIYGGRRGTWAMGFVA
jgi:hypothetical protein